MLSRPRTSALGKIFYPDDGNAIVFRHLAMCTECAGVFSVIPASSAPSGRRPRMPQTRQRLIRVRLAMPGRSHGRPTQGQRSRTVRTQPSPARPMSQVRTDPRLSPARWKAFRRLTRICRGSWSWPGRSPWRSGGRGSRPPSVAEDLLRPVAVVGVPIQDGRAPSAVVHLGLTGHHGDVVEEAEVSGARPPGVMPGRMQSREGVSHLPGHDLVDRLHRGAGAAQRRLQVTGRDGGVVVILDGDAPSGLPRDGGEVGFVVRTDKGGGRDGRRLLADRVRETPPFQAPPGHPDAARPFGMFRRREMRQGGGMRVVQRRHPVPA
jgi:hypothetical protein